MTRPLVSVILTAYNDGKYLKHTLEALVGQTLQDIEIICIDDKSTDDTREIIREFANKDARIKLIENDKNLGLSVARNSGIAASNADLIMFCDGDDYYEKTMCERMYEAITDSEADLAICEINVIYHAHQEMKVSDDNYYALKYSGLQPITDELILKTDLSSTNKIFKRSILSRYQLKFPVGLRFEDAFFCTAYFLVSNKICFVEERLYNYVRHNNSIMSQTWSGKGEDKAIDHTTVAIQLFEFLEKNEKLENNAEIYWQLFESFLAFSLTNSHTNQSRNAVRKLASSFIKQHTNYFNQASADVRRRVENLCSMKPRLNTTAMKKVLIRMMPTYNLQTQNIQQLHTLKRRCSGLLKDSAKYGSNK